MDQVAQELFYSCALLRVFFRGDCASLLAKFEAKYSVFQGIEARVHLGVDIGYARCWRRFRGLGGFGGLTRRVGSVFEIRIRTSGYDNLFSRKQKCAKSEQRGE